MLKKMMVMGWLRSRRKRFIFLLLCSPFLLPLLCLAFPFLCIAELCLGLCRRRVDSDEKGRSNRYEDGDGSGLRRCEEGRSGDMVEEERKVRLLQRYLEDQLGLVGSVYDCGDDGFGDDGEVDDDDLLDNTTPLLQ
ncbi:PREDICTED: uncharacterized protein LOC104586971 [Nelumbo nucifera]|uniref:Uncharacterized protein LOC104586971 n=2 Tax=Nelumbo nucifera TaxID=4432 RepID=A0A1U7YXC7_NELNU|nr:PREDICTED: uncharacterized protein LOC104586971 [Nelumbo nucifera]DAD39077.1 TPA_asm: hypothetical protein HUJ06_013400 [Nelumbo nucifera]